MLGSEDVTRNVVFDPGKNFDLYSYEVPNEMKQLHWIWSLIRPEDDVGANTCTSSKRKSNIM
jgi:hypothetical protein